MHFIKYIFIFPFILLIISCSPESSSQKTTKKQDSSSQKIPKKLISGSWTVSSVMNSVGNIDSIPNEQKYILKLSADNKNKTFEVDNVKGNWDLKDSILTMENIPESKEYVDSIFIINDAYGNSEVILKSLIGILL